MECYQSPKIFFSHIMKTGGTTVNNYLHGYFAEEEILYDASTPKELDGMTFELIRKARFVRGHFEHTITDYFGQQNGFQVIGLLRHPVSRVHSHYWHLMRAPDIDPSFNFLREQNLSFEEFVNSPECALLASNYQVSMYGTPEEADAETVPDEESLRVAKSYIDRCCVVGVTEDLDGFIQNLADYFGFAQTPPVLTKNRSYASKAEMSDALIEKIKQMNALDMELYDYALRKIAETKITPKRKIHPIAIDETGFARWNVTKPFSGNGWGDLQRSQIRHRWSEVESATLFISRHYSGQMIGFLAIARFVGPRQMKNFRVFINGEEVKLQQVHAEGQSGDRFSFQVPPSDQKIMELCIHVDELMSFSQVDPTSNDTDLRGLALMGIGLDPMK